MSICRMLTVCKQNIWLIVRYWYYIILCELEVRLSNVDPVLGDFEFGYLSVWRHHFFTNFYLKGYIIIVVNQVLYYFISNEKVVAPYGNFSLNSNNIHIMNVYECNGANMFMSWKMECSIQRGGAELNGTFQLSTYSHHCTHKHSLFVLYNIQVDLCHFDWKIQLSKQTISTVKAEC